MRTAEIILLRARIQCSLVTSFLVTKRTTASYAATPSLYTYPMSDKSSIAGRKKLESTREAKLCWGRAGRAQARGLGVLVVHFKVEKQQHNSSWEALMGQQRCPHLVPGRKTFPASSSTKRSTSGTGSAAISPIHQLLLCRIGAGQHHTCVLPVLGHERGFSLSGASCRNRDQGSPCCRWGFTLG